MIRLIRPAIPATLAKKGKKAAAQLKRLRTRGKTEFSFSAAIYRASGVRVALRAMHLGKCAFCESILPQSTAGHVEHFRPKGEVQQDIDQPLLKPGYYWLAYEWSNLLLGCEWCNSRAKHSLFPLVDPARRARTHHDKLTDETPLLLNPSEVDPSLHLEFVGEEVRPRSGSLHGETSIRIYRLNDLGLTDQRRKKLALFRALQTLARNTTPKPEVDEALAEARLWETRIQSGEIEYSAMLRANL